MSQQTGRIEELRFETAQLIGVGSYFDSYSTRSINGTIESISLGSNNFVNIGSLLIYFSGTLPAFDKKWLGHPLYPPDRTSNRTRYFDQTTSIYHAADFCRCRYSAW